MRKARTLLPVLALAIAAPLLLAACGDDENGGAGGGAGGSGGEIVISQTSQPDYLDPALSYTVNGWEPMWVVYTPLLTYRHEEGEAGSQLIPGLAEELPEITNGGRTYTLNLRDNLEFSDGTPVRASDFEHTIKRVLNLESGGSPFYLGIRGAEEYVNNGNAQADIPGIRTNNRTGEITIELVEPDAAFSNVLAMNFAGIVPGDTPFRNMTQDPPPGVGAYVITRSEPNREFVLEKSPNFASLNIPDIPTGNLDRITTRIVKSLVQQTQDVIENELDYMQDPPAADLKQEVIQRFGPDGSEEQRYKEFTTLSTYFLFLNVREPPFDDPQVREAVNIGLDKPALARLFAGELQPGCAFLAPGMAGYDEELDTTGCPWGNPNEPPDLERARQMIRDAGAAGAEVIVWGNTDDPTDKVTQAYADQLNQMGFDAEPRILDGGVYFQTIGNQNTAPQTGFANWFADFPHPLNFYFLVDGDSIQPTNNQNFGNVDDPRINRTIDRLRLETDTEAVADEWAELDRYLVESAYIVPYGHRRLATFFSERMDFENCAAVHPLYQNDYSQFCLEEGE